LQLSSSSSSFIIITIEALKKIDEIIMKREGVIV